ncbi:MAG: AtpZ/AtpI family protein [Planctomycetota bacterium]
MADHRPSSSVTTDQAQAWALALQVVAVTVAGGLLGLLIDYLAGTAPWFLIGLALSGLVGGVIRFVREASAMNTAAAGRFKRDHPQVKALPDEPEDDGPAPEDPPDKSTTT